MKCTDNRRCRSRAEAAGGTGVVYAASVAALGVAGVLGAGIAALGQGDEPAISTAQSLIKLTNNGTVSVGGDDNTISFLSGHTVSLPFGGPGHNNFFGGGSGGDGGDGIGTAVAGGGLHAGIAAGNAGNGVDIPIGQSPATLADNVTLFHGAGETFVFFSGNTLNLPFGGVAENNFFGGGSGGNGGDGIATAVSGTNAASEMGIPANPLAGPLAHTGIFLPGSGDTFVLPSYNTLNLPFGGVGENNFFGGGNGGNAGAGLSTAGAGAGVADPRIAASGADAVVFAGTGLGHIPFENVTIVLPGAYDTIVLPAYNAINLPFGDVGYNNFLGDGLAGTATAGDSAGDGYSEWTTPMLQFRIPWLNDTIVLPGSHDTFVFPAHTFLGGNTIRLPFFGDGANSVFGHHFGAGSAGGGTATEHVGGGAAVPADHAPAPVPGTAVFLPGSGDTIVLPSHNTINLPFGGVGENNFLGGGNGGNGAGGGDGGAGVFGAAGGAGYHGDGSNVSVSSGGGSTAIGIGGGGGDGGAGAQFLHYADGSGSGGTAGAAGHGPVLPGVVGDPSGGAIAIGIGGDGGNGGNGAVFLPIHTGAGAGGHGAGAGGSGTAEASGGSASGTGGSAEATTQTNGNSAGSADGNAGGAATGGSGTGGSATGGAATGGAGMGTGGDVNAPGATGETVANGGVGIGGHAGATAIGVGAAGGNGGDGPVFFPNLLQGSLNGGLFGSAGTGSDGGGTGGLFGSGGAGDPAETGDSVWSNLFGGSAGLPDPGEAAANIGSDLAHGAVSSITGELPDILADVTGSPL